jgi:hypothetical protein
VSDTIGLTVKVGAETTDARKDVDSLAAYARKQLGSIPLGLGGGAPGGSGGGGGAGGGPSGAKSKVDKLLREMEKEIRNAQNRMRGHTLQDVVFGKMDASAISTSLSLVRGAVADAKISLRNLLNDTTNMSGKSMTRIERMWARLEQTERLSKNVEKRHDDAIKASVRSVGLPIIDNSPTQILTARQRAREEAKRAREEAKKIAAEAGIGGYPSKGFTEAQRDPFYSQMLREKARLEKERMIATKPMGGAVPPELAKYLDQASTKQTELQLSRLGGGSLGKGDAEDARRKIDELGASFSKAFSAMPVKTKEAVEALQRMRTVLGGLRNDVNQMDLARMKGNHNLGVFGNRGISGAFSLQQAVEDASYAGIRGAANNIAFFLAEMAPAGGAGMYAAGAGILGIMGLQIYELGNQMGWWNKQAHEMAKEAERLAGSMGRLSGSLLGVQMSGANLGSQSALGAFSSTFMGPRGKSYADTRNSAIRGMMQGQSGQQLLGAVSAAIQANPSQFLGAGGVGAPSRDAKGQKKVLLGNMSSLNLASGLAARSSGTASNWVAEYGGLMGYPMNWGEWLGDVITTDPFSSLDETASQKKAKRNESAKKDMLRALSGAGKPGERLSAEIQNTPADMIDYSKFLEKIRKEVENLTEKYEDLSDTQAEATDVLSQNSDEAAKSVLALAQTNDTVADSVQRVIEQNKELNAEYERQKAILREKAVLEDRNNFRGQGFDLMRSNSRKFMEQAGAPEWMIQNRERALYQRQGSMLMGMANAAGESGDMESRIKYLKELQGLQMQYAGTTDNRMSAERTFESAIRTQQMIEESIRRNVDGSRQEYELIQNLANGVAGIRDIITSMPPIELQTERAVLGVDALNQRLSRTLGLTSAIRIPAASGEAFPSNAAFGVAGFAKGGHIPGYGGGDTVPALLEKGEFIINKAAVKALGVDTLHELNGAGSVRKFAAGGWSGTGYEPVYSTYSRSRYRNDRRQHGLGAHLRDYRGERPSVLARESVNEYHAKYGSPTHRERLALMNDPAMTGSTRPVGMPPLAARRGGTPGKTTVGDWTHNPYSMRRDEIGSIITGGGYAQIPGDPHGVYTRSSWKIAMGYQYPGLSNSGPVNPFNGYTAKGNRQRGIDGARARTLARSSNDNFYQGMWQYQSEVQNNREKLKASYAQRAKDLRKARADAKLNASVTGFNTWRQRGMGNRGQGGGFANQGYINQLFGPGFSPYMGGMGGYGWGMPQMGLFGNMGGVGGFGFQPAVQQYGLWDQGGLGMGGVWGNGGFGFRGFAGGGFVNPYSGTFISPDVVEERVGYERLGNWADPSNAYNWNSFMMQRQRLLAGSRNAAYGGPTDFAGNTLGSFGQFSDGSYKSRYSGGFGSGMGGKGFGSMFGGGFGSGMGGGFSSFGKPIGAMTGGYITGPQQIQRYSSGGSVGQSRPSSNSSIHNNFGEITIRVDSNDRAVDAAEQMRRAKSSYWAQRG